MNYESSDETLERQNNYETGYANSPFLDAARQQFINELKDLQPGEKPAPIIERFLPAASVALYPVLKVAITIIGRQKVINFLAGLLAKLVGKYVPANIAQPLAAGIIDVGMGAIGFEVHETGNGNLAYEAIANTIEETVQNMSSLNETALNDTEELTMELLQSFEQAAANNFPSGFKKYGIELDYSRPTYTGDKKAIAILNAPHISDLRSLCWATRFYKAGLEDDVVVAQIAVARNVLNDLIQRFDPNNYLSRFNNAYPNLWAFIYESNNSRPSILHTALKNAVVRATSSGIYDPVQFGRLLIAELNTATSNYYHAKIYKSEQEKATRIKDELAKVGRIIEKTGISK